MKLGLVVALALAGCRGQTIPEWTLEDGSRVELPSTLAWDVPLRVTHLRMRAEVAIAPDERGEPLTIVFDCFHGPLALSANGVALSDIGETGPGEHRFVIPRAQTAAATIALEVDATRNALSVIGFGTAPRLVPGEVTEPGFAIAFDRDTAIAELGLIAVFALMFGMAYVLDRRRTQDAAFAVGVLFASVAPLWQLGILDELGVVGSIALGVGISGSQIAVLQFNYAEFDRGPVPRWQVRMYVCLAFANLLDIVSIRAELVVVALYMAAGLFSLGHAVGVLWRAARTPGHRRDARRLLVATAITLALVSPDLVGLMIGHSPFGGLHLVSAGIFTFAIAQALALARQQAMRQQALEQTAAELQRQVAERSRELADALAQLAQQPHALEADRTIDGRYRIVRKLGAGGMGAVYEVERLGDGKRFALKTLRGRADTDLMARFAREAQVAAELSHPNLLPVLDVGISEGGLFLVMPLVTGGSLEHERAKFGDAAWARPILRQIAEGLAALHARGIVHRDLKPANVLLANGVARIADFGLASLRADAMADTLAESGMLASPSPALTRAGDLFGTPAYMAPELASGVQHVKPSSDVFAFGMIAHELMTGQPAFAEPPVIARLHGHTIGEPGAGDPLFARCLALDPANRPTAAELAAALG